MNKLLLLTLLSILGGGFAKAYQFEEVERHYQSEIEFREMVRERLKEPVTEQNAIEQKIAEGRERIATKIDTGYRVEALESFLTSVNSPVAGKAHFIISECEKRTLDYKIMVAIAGAESSYWKYCHRWNCYGWGITDSGTTTDHLDWSSFEAGFVTWLDGFVETGYTGSVDNISYSGYNTRQSWRDTVNYIYTLID